jgi:hypothetical protein
MSPECWKYYLVITQHIRDLNETGSADGSDDFKNSIVVDFSRCSTKCLPLPKDAPNPPTVPENLETDHQVALGLVCSGFTLGLAYRWLVEVLKLPENP